MKKILLFSLVFGLLIIANPTSAIYDPNRSIEGDGDATIMAVPMLAEVTTQTEETVNTNYALYVDPTTKTEHKINNAFDALKVMQKYSLGINQKNYKKFALETPQKLDGKIILNTEDKGKAYLVDYKNNKLIFLGKPRTAFQIFKSRTPQKITAKKWSWVKTIMNNDETITPNKTEAFTLTFNDDGKINGTTDCNNFFGQYEKNKDNLTFGPLASTRMFCEGSQENIFTKQLSQVDKLFFDSKGNLVLLLKLDSGSIIFK